MYHCANHRRIAVSPQLDAFSFKKKKTYLRTERLLFNGVRLNRSRGREYEEIEDSYPGRERFSPSGEATGSGKDETHRSSVVTRGSSAASYSQELIRCTPPPPIVPSFHSSPSFVFSPPLTLFLSAPPPGTLAVTQYAPFLTEQRITSSTCAAGAGKIRQRGH